MSNKKKILVSLIITILIITTTIVSNASSEGVITGETVKLRKEPSMEGKLVTLLSVDNKVEVLGKDGEWYHIKYKEYEGYVFQDYVKVKEQIKNEDSSSNETNSKDKENNISKNEVTENNINSNENSNTANNETEQNEEKTDNQEKSSDVVGTEQYIAEDVCLKILPLINSDTLEDIEKGIKVTVQDDLNGWVYVYTENSAGWVRKDKLSNVKTTEDDSKNNSDEKEDKSYTAYVDASSVNLREKANSDSKILKTLTTNAKVTVEKVEADWAKVTTSDGTKGYISNEYLSKTKVKETNRSGNVEREPLETKNEKVETKSETKEDTKKENNSTTSSSSSNEGKDVVSYAKTYLGAKYVYGGDGPNSFDCSGFTQYIYKKFGVSLPHSASAQSAYGKSISKSNLKQGDLVFFTGHVGIYVGNNKFIHAANPSKGVVITSLSDSYYKKNYITARRIF